MPTKASSHGQTLAALTFEEVPIKPIAAHDRDTLASVEVGAVPAYSVFPIGRKTEFLRRQRAFAATEPAPL